MTARITPGRTLTSLVWATVVGILLQAVFAGQFISGLTNALGVHSIVGTVLEVIGLAPRGRCGGRPAHPSTLPRPVAGGAVARCRAPGSGRPWPRPGCGADRSSRPARCGVVRGGDGVGDRAGPTNAAAT